MRLGLSITELGLLVGLKRGTSFDGRIDRSTHFLGGLVESGGALEQTALEHTSAIFFLPEDVPTCRLKNRLADSPSIRDLIREMIL